MTKIPHSQGLETSGTALGLFHPGEHVKLCPHRDVERGRPGHPGLWSRHPTRQQSALCFLLQTLSKSEWFEPGQRTEMLMMGMEEWIAPHRDHGFDCIFTARLPVALWPLSALCSPASFKHFRISLVSSSRENGWAGGFCWLYQETWQPMTGWQMLCLPSRCPLYTSGNVWLLTGAEVDHHHIDIGCGSHRLSRQKVGVEGHLCDLSN